MVPQIVSFWQAENDFMRYCVQKSLSLSPSSSSHYLANPCLIFRYSNNPGVLSGLVLLLVPLAHSKNGIKWLEKNYITLMNAYEAFNKELEFHIPNLEGLPMGLGQSLETFTSALEKV